MKNKDTRITGIEFRGIIIGSFREYREVKDKEIEEIKPKPVEEPKGLPQPEPEEIHFDTNYIQSIIGSYEDWRNFKTMVRKWAKIEPVPKPEAKADVSDHDAIMKMSSG